MSVSQKALLAAVAYAVGLIYFDATPTFAREAKISQMVYGSPLSVSVNPDIHAGAIDSITFRGVEYVDNYDHGRQIQSAIQVDNLGECFNPTEAGSKADGAARKTSSAVRVLSSTGNVLRSETMPAFWLAPREPYGKACSSYRRETRAQNGTVLSNYTIRRTSRFYGAAIPNLLLVDIKITLPERRQSASIEALTGYLPGNFRSFYSYNRRSRRLRALRASPEGGRTTDPVIIATLDGRHAFGVLSPAITGVRPDQAYYAYFFFPGVGATAKWSCVFGELKIQAGATLAYSCPVAVGTLTEVMASFDAYGRLPNR